MTKKYCFIIPVYNNQQGLDATINSIIAAYPDASVIVYDDGSRIPVNCDFFNTVKLYRSDVNMGIGYGLNFLIDKAYSECYDYAFLIDAGDLLRAGRVEAQINFFEKSNNKDLCIIGGGMNIIDATNNSFIEYFPELSGNKLRKQFRRGYPFVHPTAAFDLKKFTAHGIRYNLGIDSCVDYEMLYRLHIKCPNSIENIDKILVDYVREPNSIGVKKSAQQARLTLKFRLKNAKISDIDSLLGVIDVRLILRSISPRIFYFISNILKNK